MSTITVHGITLSAHAARNDSVILARPVGLTPGAGDFANRAAGRARREMRRAKAAARFAWIG